jgi:hypothetical protein
MSLDSTARESNVLDSLKKYFKDMGTVQNITVRFDINVSQPNLVRDKSVNKWVIIDIDEVDIDVISTIVITIHICTRKDNEGFVLSQLRDTVMEYLSVNYDSETRDNFKRIPFYRSNTNPWSLIGQLLVVDVKEGKRINAPDKTKFKDIIVTLKTPSKI